MQLYFQQKLIIKLFILFTVDMWSKGGVSHEDLMKLFELLRCHYH